MPEPKKCVPAAAAGLVLTLMLGACGSAAEEEPQAPDAAGAQDEPADVMEEPAEAEIELRDPMEMAPDDLCTVLPEEVLEELLGAEDMRDDSPSTTGRPDPGTLESDQRLRMNCMLLSLSGFTLRYDMEIHEGPYTDSAAPDLTAEEADPDLGVGDLAVAGSENDAGSAQVTAVEGQVFVDVHYSRMGSGDADAMLDGALLAAEELLAAVNGS
ncbi:MULTISPECIES: hypothetical protein [Nocardiopsidaceae]|uniref:DUF3558 domain-containing protein n=1 Tax=Streptomonospora nanhaiensis TaxID=1323731 RepID=A0ABY6YNR9_9ACTN|nr:hypothetical protein [Streptomonospora nanhaiensis]WAE73836.1 hypothetical protein OUQ99_01525 [Streptomonospora nanhaiensis]